MNYKYIILEIEGGVATVFLNRPDVRNAMNLPMMKEIGDCFTFLSKQSDVRIILLRGKGDSFCAGADIQHMKHAGGQSTDQNRTDSQLLADLYYAVDHCPQPVVGVVHGHAFGGGFGLCNVCDITIAEEKTLFALSEVLIGIIPAIIGPYTVNKIGLSAYRALGISGERFDGHYAEKIGLVQYAVPKDQIEDIVDSTLAQLKKGSPKAQEMFKEYIRNMENLDAQDAIIAMRASEEGQEGLSAFIEKRKPSWQKD
ncbi:MAG: enoyl-CoA hydratase/isomerase family protein [Candidatus Marinimicrobia bacterium]|nr:enoyl-CoA hydratase/isomerase family protein [Candidatus Neomarinimicrobiota bacterium]